MNDRTDIWCQMLKAFNTVPVIKSKFYCREGYAPDLTRTVEEVSNMHSLECTVNGSCAQIHVQSISVVAS